MKLSESVQGIVNRSPGRSLIGHVFVVNADLEVFELAFLVEHLAESVEPARVFFKSLAAAAGQGDDGVVADLPLVGGLAIGPEPWPSS